MNSIKCYNCGLVNWAATGGCKRCGAVFMNPGPADYQPYQAAPTDHQAYQQHDAAAPDGQWEHGYGEEGYGEQEQQQQQQYHHHTGRDYYAPQYQSAPYNQSYYPESPKQKGLAIASLVLGILGAVTFGLFGIGAILGLIFGIVAYRRAKRNPAQYGGEGQALAGIIISSISILMFLYIAVVAAIAVPNLMASRRAANEGAAIRALRTLSSAEATYQATVGSSASYGTMEELFRAGLIDAKLASKMNSGYRFEITVTPRSSFDPAKYEVVATPLTYGTTGTRSFFIDESGVVRGADRRGAEATVSDNPLGTTSRSEVDADYDGISPPTRRMRY